MNLSNLRFQRLIKPAFFITLLFISSNLYAKPFDFTIPGNIEYIEANGANSQNLNFLELEFIEFHPLQNLMLLKDNLFTLYQNKNETIKATYLEGAYALNYTQNW